MQRKFKVTEQGGLLHCHSGMVAIRLIQDRGYLGVIQVLIFQGCQTVAEDTVAFVAPQSTELGGDRAHIAVIALVLRWYERDERKEGKEGKIGISCCYVSEEV